LLTHDRRSPVKDGRDRAQPGRSPITGERSRPGLAAAILDIPDPDPTLAPEAVTVAALRPREIRRLAAQTVMTERIRWYTFAKAPAKLWLRRARGDLRRARSLARRVLGRDPHNDAETMRVLAERPAEVAAVSLSAAGWTRCW
jgi:hypothetical protein